jgi:hypothetical protein
MLQARAALFSYVFVFYSVFRHLTHSTCRFRVLLRDANTLIIYGEVFFYFLQFARSFDHLHSSTVLSLIPHSHLHLFTITTLIGVWVIRTLPPHPRHIGLGPFLILIKLFLFHTIYTIHSSCTRKNTVSTYTLVSMIF